MDWLVDPRLWAGLVTLTALEIVLGIDNLVLVSVVTARLPVARRGRAMRLGLGGALVFRLALLASLSWIIGLTQPLVEVFGFALSWRDIVLVCGGVFLMAKGTHEIHATVEGGTERRGGPATLTLPMAIVQIMLFDAVFSLDSIITAVGMVEDVAVMMVAVVIAVAIMMWLAGPVGDFLARYPSLKMLALSFLLLVGVALVADGLHFHIPRAYLYFAIGFSSLVEILNVVALRRRRRRRRVGQ